MVVTAEWLPVRDERRSQVRPRTRRRASATVVAAVLGLVALAGCVPVTVPDQVAIAPPNPSATRFAESFSMDEGRVVASARVGASPVVYVFDRTASGWSHSATLTPSPGSSSLWGSEVAVSGDTLAIADAGSGGTIPSAVEIYDLGPGGWTRAQIITDGVAYDWPSLFTLGLTGDGLLVHEGSTVCDQSPCPTAPWTLYQRSDGVFAPVFASGRTRTAIEISIGVDQGRLALGGPGYGEVDSNLMAWDAGVVPAQAIVDETMSVGDGRFEGPYRHVDLSGGLLAYESCCPGPAPAGATLDIRRDSGSGYAPEASFLTARNIASISVLPEAVLVADHDVGRWHTFVMRDGVWQRGNDIQAPDAVAATFPGPPMAVGNEVAVRGDGVLWVLTVDPGPSGRS